MFSIDPEMTVEEALTVFFGSEHLGREAYEDAVNYAKIGPITIPFPNPSARRRIVYLHDVNHILSGYDTTFGGEGEVSAWELASGFPRHCWIGYFYAPIAFTAGLFVAPLRMWKAWKRGRKEKNSCHAPLSREQMMATKVGDLRRMLSIHYTLETGPSVWANRLTVATDSSKIFVNRHGVIDEISSSSSCTHTQYSRFEFSEMR